MEQPGRYELEVGTVIAMSPETPGHVRFKTTIQRALADAIQRAGLDCEAVGDHGTVVVDTTTAYEPDASVCSGAVQPDTAPVDPVIVVEVVSPDPASGSRGGRLVDYFSLPSVEHYLIVDAERCILIHHARRGDDIATRILHGGTLRLDPPGLGLQIEDLFGESGEH